MSNRDKCDTQSLPPEKIARAPGSYTGQYLRRILFPETAPANVASRLTDPAV